MSVSITATSGRELLRVIGKSLAFPGTNAFIGAHHGAEILVALAPPWADLIAADFPDIADVQRELWTQASQPLATWPEAHQRKAQESGRVEADGSVRLVEAPERMLVMVCGGLGNLHALALHSFGATHAVTRPF